MTFGNPTALLWGLLAIPILLLYLRRSPSPRQATATGCLWEQVFAQAQSRSKWHRCRHPVSLLLQLTILTLLVLALADPRFGDASPAARERGLHTAASLRENARHPSHTHAESPAWVWLSVAALGTVAGEWCLFQRRWTC